MISREEAIKKGYLENKKIVLKPSPRGGNMGIDKPTHAAFFQIDNGATFFSLPRTVRGDLVNPFKSETEEERKFFEEVLGLELNTSKPGNWFESPDSYVKITKDTALMYKGEPFDMSDPINNLRVRILRANQTIAPNKAERLNRVEYRWYLEDESDLNKEDAVEYDSIMKMGMYLGKINNDLTKMKNALKIYFSSIGSSKTIKSDDSEQIIKSEFKRISNDKDEREKFLRITEDPLFDNKLFVLKGIEAGAIKKDGNNVYLFVGEETTYTFNEIAKKTFQMSEDDDELYLKVLAQIEGYNKK